MRQPAVSVCADRRTQAGTLQAGTPAPVEAVSQRVAPTPPVGHGGIQPPAAGVPQAAALGTITLSFNATPEVLRALLLLLQGSAGDCGSLSNPSLNGFGAPEAGTAPAPSPPAPHVESNEQEICRDAETLLATLSRVRREAERSGSLEHAWCSMAKWFLKTGMDRHRKDASHLIGQLLASKLVEFREHGPKKGWQQYQATNAGMQRAERRLR